MTSRARRRCAFGVWCNADVVARVVALCLAVAATGCGGGRVSALDRLHPCVLSEGPADAFCGTLRVFENRHAATGRTIDLKIVVAPALRRHAAPDPLFVFEGGPGGGAATLASFRIPMFRRFQIDRDIVLVDQRGTGASNPLDCTPDENTQPEREADVREADVRQADDVSAELAAYDDYPVDKFRRCLDRLDADPRLYSTATAMDDIDEVRSYLGYEQINLWGGSYGTRAALVYLKRYEERVRTVVLDGVAPTDMRLPLFMARDSQRALDRMLDDCATSLACAREFPQLKQTVSTLWARAASRPSVAFVHPRTGTTQTVTVSPRFVAAVVFQALYSPELSTLLPRLLTDAAAGEYRGLFALAFSRDMPKGSFSDGMFLSVVCAEDLPRISPDDIERETSGRFIGTVMFDTQMKPCAFWPRALVADDYYEPVVSNRPVLIFSGEHDPVTPPSWGEYVAAHMPHATHLVVPGAGHIAITRGCVPQLVATFLDDGHARALESGCLNGLVRPPFFTTYTRPDAP